MLDISQNRDFVEGNLASNTGARFDVASELGEWGLTYSTQHRPGVICEEQDEFASDYLDEEFRGLDLDISLGNCELPVHNYREVIAQSVNENPVTIIVAETGAGKSTQVPQYLLDEGYNSVYLTQPRRAAARNVFMRIRDEISGIRGRFAGEDLVSYQTAGDREGPKDARIKVVTDGLHLARELHDKGIDERDVLIIDEAHEWNSNVEVLVAWSKKIIDENPNHRVVIMSATMDADHLADYYADVCPDRPPIIDIPGRTHKVEMLDKPESTVVDEVMNAAFTLQKDESVDDESRAILAFEPGKKEIQDAIDAIRKRLTPELAEVVKIFPLHAKLPKLEQQKALTQYPGHIKIVVASNVAQTSLTIPDVKYVIDSGYQRRIEVDDEGTKGLTLNAISQADCLQRAGRAGRVSDGTYVRTRLNATTPHVPFEERDEYPLPEILRTDVAQHALSLRELEIDMHEFDMYHKASRQILELAEVNLKTLGALEEDGSITETGMQMNMYPLCTSSARIMLEACRYREETRAYLAAAVSAKEAGGLQYFSQNVGKRWMELTEETESDLLVQLDIFIATQHMSPKEILEYDLDIDNVIRTREYFQKVAKLSGANADTLTPPSDKDREDIKACIYAGYLTSIYQQVGSGEYKHASQGFETKRELSNRSLVEAGPRLVVGDPYRVEFIAADSDTQERIPRHFIENVTVVNIQSLGNVATQHVIWRPEEYLLKDGKVFQSHRQTLFGIDLGVTREVQANPSPELRQLIIEHAMENPGAEQKKLRNLKKELERLSHLAKHPVPRLSHDDIVALVGSAAPEDITNPATIEDNLRLLLNDSENGISIDAFVSPERRERILQDAPEVIELNGEVARLKYRNGTPIINVRNPSQFSHLEFDEASLPDGRQIKFSYSTDRNSRRRLYTLQQLQRFV